MNLYGMLEKLAENLPNQTDKQAALEVIQKLRKINAFGSTGASIESDTDETVHVHIWETKWDNMNAGKLVDRCRECDQAKGSPYDPRFTGGNGMYFRR